jgi:hypothetical protein
MTAAQITSIPCAVCGAQPGGQCIRNGKPRRGACPWRRARAAALFAWMGPADLSPWEKSRRKKLTRKMPRKRER